MSARSTAQVAREAIEERLFPPPVETDDEVLCVNVDGYEGPLDLLLALARTQKVDMSRISVLALADQYLRFVEEARVRRLELRADCLVMAAWLTYLKSRLLLPAEEEEEPSGEDLAAALALRLRRLEAMRACAHALMERPRLGRDVLARGAPEEIETVAEERWDASLYELLAAYAAVTKRAEKTTLAVGRTATWTLERARETLSAILSGLTDWAPLDVHLRRYVGPGEERTSARASTFCAGLEMAREGALELRQTSLYGPLYVRSCGGARR